MSKAYVGIDPGNDGALAILKEDWKGCILVPFSKEDYISEISMLVGAGYEVKCVLEHVGGIPGQSAPASFTFGANFGWITGVLEVLRVPYELVRPQKWKKEFSCTSDKNTAVECAKRLFPGTDLRKNDRCRKDHDGLAEALLMAEYARRRLG